MAQDGGLVMKAVQDELDKGMARLLSDAGIDPEDRDMVSEAAAALREYERREAYWGQFAGRAQPMPDITKLTTDIKQLCQRLSAVLGVTLPRNPFFDTQLGESHVPKNGFEECDTPVVVTVEKS